MQSGGPAPPMKLTQWRSSEVTVAAPPRRVWAGAGGNPLGLGGRFMRSIVSYCDPLWSIVISCG